MCSREQHIKVVQHGTIGLWNNIRFQSLCPGFKSRALCLCPLCYCRLIVYIILDMMIVKLKLSPSEDKKRRAKDKRKEDALGIFCTPQTSEQNYKKSLKAFFINSGGIWSHKFCDGRSRKVKKKSSTNPPCRQSSEWTRIWHVRMAVWT